MGGGGKGGSEGGGTKGQDMLSNLISGLNAETAPIRDILNNQYQEALTTGGIGARLPIASAAQEQSRSATSNALRGDTEMLTRMGLGRTPFAASVLAGERMKGEQATSLIPSQVAQSFIGSAPSYSMAPVGAMIGGAGSLASTQAGRDVAKGNQQTQLYTGLMQMAASGFKSYMGGA